MVWNESLIHRRSSLQQTRDAVGEDPQIHLLRHVTEITHTSDETPLNCDHLRDYVCHDRLYTAILDAMTSLFRLGFLQKLRDPLLQALDALFDEHLRHPSGSRLKAVIPEIGVFFTPLPFAEAFKIYDKKYGVTKRRFVPPSVNEIRHIMNIAQIVAIKDNLRLISFDGDETLYPNGQNFSSVETASYIATLLKKSVYVAVVTAAGYGYQVDKYEARLAGLLEYFKQQQLPSHIVHGFIVFGGESNYLLRCGHDYHLQPVPESLWRCHLSSRMKGFFDEDNQMGSKISRLLAVATSTLEEFVSDLDLRALVVQKKRAVGLIPGGEFGKLKSPNGSGRNALKPEILDEAVFRVRNAVRKQDPPLEVPYCAFNGGTDMWVDVGNKAEGLLILQSFLGVKASECLHIGDQFTISGNDVVARDVTPTLWICNPHETQTVLRSLLKPYQHQESDLTHYVDMHDLKTEE